MTDADAPAAVSQSALRACAVIGAESERLACYDALARRSAPRETRAPAPQRAEPAAQSPPREAFGLYSAEHPAVQLTTQSVAARVVRVSANPGGRPIVELEGGQRWELDEPDALLAAGDPVSIRRAALGSFLMTTPAKRTHRVRRLR
jgi:hypothetical protein